MKTGWLDEDGMKSKQEKILENKIKKENIKLTQLALDKLNKKLYKNKPIKKEIKMKEKDNNQYYFNTPKGKKTYTLVFIRKCKQMLSQGYKLKEVCEKYPFLNVNTLATWKSKPMKQLSRQKGFKKYISSKKYKKKSSNRVYVKKETQSGLSTSNYALNERIKQLEAENKGLISVILKLAKTS